MICEEIQEQLNAFYDGELNGQDAKSINAHISDCEQCRREYQSIESLRVLLRDNDILDTRPLAIVAQPVKRMRIARLGMAAAAACLIAGVIVTGSMRPRKSFAAEVQDAIAHTTTYHLRGWRQAGGKKIDWEVWGRRYPYVYCEKVGGDWVYDNGIVQTRIYAPDPASGRLTGTVVKVESSNGKFSDASAPEWNHMIDPGFWHDGQIEWLKPIARTSASVTYGRQFPLGTMAGVNANELFTIDQRKRLPVHYCLRYKTSKVEWVSQDMTIDCDVNLPKEAYVIPATPEYRIVDLRPKGIPPSSQMGPDTDLRIGLSLKTQPMVVAHDGTIAIATNVSPQTTRPEPAIGPPFSFSVAPAQTMVVECLDMHGKLCSAPYMDAFYDSSPPGNFLVLTPIDDLPAGWRPVRVKLPVTTTVRVAVTGIDMLGSDGRPVAQRAWNTELTKETNTVSIPLMQPGIAQEMAPFLSRNAGPYGHFSKRDIERQIASAHRSYWWGKRDYIAPASGGPVKTSMEEQYVAVRHKDLAKAAGWAIKEAELIDRHAPNAYMRLYKLQVAALYYAQAGRIDLEYRTLKRLLAESKTVSGVDELRRDTQLALLGKKLPGK